MGTLIMAGQMILSLSILIILHECGHFFPAKWFKTRVEKFYLFFDPYFSLVKKKIGETEYGIGWLPLGGYVKIAGMIDESMDREQMKKPPQPWEFRSKPAWQRLIIMLGGVTVNFFLGMFLFAMVLNVWGEDFLPSKNVKYGIAVAPPAEKIGLKDGDHILKIGSTDFEKFNPGILINELVINRAKDIDITRDGTPKTLHLTEEQLAEVTDAANNREQFIAPRMLFIIAEVSPEGNAQKAGMKAGDQVVSINGEPIQYFHEFRRFIEGKENQTLDIGVRRNGQIVNLMVQTDENAKIGVIQKTDQFEFDSKKYSFAAALPAGYKKGMNFLSSQIKSFGLMFKGKIKAKDSLGSFISIGKLYGNVWNWKNFWNMTATLSLLLAFINLLPIPALDGGHVMFLLWEIITGKKPSDRFLEVMTVLGFALLMTLMIYALGLDIWRIFK